MYSPDRSHFSKNHDSIEGFRCRRAHHDELQSQQRDHRARPSGVLPGRPWDPIWDPIIDPAGPSSSMSTLLKRARQIITNDDQRTVLDDADILIVDGRIRAIGSALDHDPDRVIDCSGCVVLPGFVNTHHHLYQTLTRNLPGAQDAGLFDWLQFHYPIWANLDAGTVYAGALVGLAELLLTGCTTSTDHFYVFPKGQPKDLLDNEIRAARELGIRFLPTRGSMSLGESDGGLPPDSIVQTESDILDDCQRLISAYHDPGPDSMCRIGLAPCSPFSVTHDLMRETAALARENNLLIHTHLAETIDEERYCLDQFGMRPVALMDSLGWLTANAWYAHCVHLDDSEIASFASHGVGVAHCPTSNMRLGSGVARVPAMRRAGVPVGLGVDGSASNDSSDMLGELRNCLLAHRAVGGPQAIRLQEVLDLATRGGAGILGWDIGALAPGKLADIAVFDTRGLAYAGGDHDPAAALVYCGFDHRARFVIVQGDVVVNEGRLVHMEEADIAAIGRRESRALLERSGLI